jgi:hypothetical protein
MKSLIIKKTFEFMLFDNSQKYSVFSCNESSVFLK